MVKILIDRYPSEENQTLGVLYVLDKNNGVLFTCKTLELPWLNNKTHISCIPLGEYKGILHDSPKFGRTIWIQDVDGRSEILIHPANFHYQLLGCIALGNDFVLIDNNDTLDASSSVDTMEEFLSFIEGDVIINIICSSCQ